MLIHCFFLFYSRFVTSRCMTLMPQWLKQVFIHHASDRCTFVDKPSTMSDVDAMFCQEKSIENRTIRDENSIDAKQIRKDTIVIDKFQACFIDCQCQCEVKNYRCNSIKYKLFFCLQAKKVIPQMTTNKCIDFKSELFNELLQQMRGSSYAIDCCCDCGKKGIRKLRFNYTTGDKAKF